MNDRFKFRVWDKINDKWMSNQLIDIEKGLLTGFYNDEEAFKRRYIIMQSTGLKDKNGKLIYEGDIVKETLTDFINEEIITVVKWDELNAMYNLENLQNCKREVIGNIYENPELLEDNQ